MQEISHFLCLLRGCPCGSADKESACSAGDLGSIPGWEDPLEKGKTTHSGIMAWRISWTVWGYKESDMTKRLTLSFMLCLKFSKDLQFRGQVKHKRIISIVVSLKLTV